MSTCDSITRPDRVAPETSARIDRSPHERPRMTSFPPSGEISRSMHSVRIRSSPPASASPIRFSSPQSNMNLNFKDFSIGALSAQDQTTLDGSSRDISRWDPSEKHDVRAVDTEPSTNHNQKIRLPQCISPEQVHSLLVSNGIDALVLDIRPRPAFEKGRVRGSMNISMPAILLKRDSQTIDKLVGSLAEDADRKRLLAWKDETHIILYDSDSFNVSSGTAMFLCAMKFANAGPLVYIVKGGFAAIQRSTLQLTESTELSTPDSIAAAIKADYCGPEFLSCDVTCKEQSPTPFFNNIRQNMDLIGGVGDPIAMKVPIISESVRQRLPNWLAHLAFDADGPQQIADKFLGIERAEQKRMNAALNDNRGHDGSMHARHSIAAGLERGDKNRYNNIWPFENARVKLHESSGCDYVNASHLHAPSSSRSYIATQGPLPTTTRDFWQVIWENEITNIIMLTRILEGGQAKCHEYWGTEQSVRPFRLELLKEYVKTERHYAHQGTPMTIRVFSLSHGDRPMEGSREIIQIQFCEWPDLHVVDPEAILDIIYNRHPQAHISDIPQVKRRKSISSVTSSLHNSSPTMVHCSAGCGRTGVFCTVDTVSGLLEARLSAPLVNSFIDDVDLIEQTVKAFRDQRLSMVQTLRQYVLCYDAILIFCIDTITRTLSVDAKATQQTISEHASS